MNSDEDLSARVTEAHTLNADLLATSFHLRAQFAAAMGRRRSDRYLAGSVVWSSPCRVSAHPNIPSTVRK
jgi:hypothetical protein